MLSPDCESGCVGEKDESPFHYWKHMKGEQYAIGERREQHRRAMIWLQIHDLRGQDPFTLASRGYTIPEGATVLPVKEE